MGTWFPTTASTADGAMLRGARDRVASSRGKPRLRLASVVGAVVFAVGAAGLASGQPAGEGEDYPRRTEGYSDSQDVSPAYGRRVPADLFTPPGVVYDAAGEYRQPVAIAFIDTTTAIVATKLTGQLWAFDSQSREVHEVYRAAERRFGRLLPLAADCLAVVDQAASSVVIFRDRSGVWEVTAELPCPGTPHSLAWSEESQTLYVSGQWSQRLYRFRAPAGTSADEVRGSNWEPLATTDLPMCGGVLQLLPKHQAILIMDAFGRDFAVVDSRSAELIKHDRVYGHNISEIVAVDNERGVLYAHQLLNEFAQSVRGDITWGGLLSNNLRWLKTERLLTESGPEIFTQGRFYPIGLTGDGAGDPTSFSLSATGAMVITLGGTDRLAIGDLQDLDFRQVDAGFHPVDCCFSPDGQLLVAVNQFSDSLTLVTLPERVVEHLPLGPLRAPTLAEQGERLFFHSSISHDGWMSCHSCHSQGHTNGQLNDNLTDESFGTPKRILSLLGQAETAPYSWGGKFEQLEEQVSHSIRSTMATDDPLAEATVTSLAAYVRSLPAPPSLLAAREQLQHPEIQEQRSHGERLFKQLGCTDCHAGPRYTSPVAVDVGLEDEMAMRRFNPPSLIGVSQRGRALFHDGRASSLEAVLKDFEHQLPRPLSDLERESMLLFLNGL